MTRLDVEAAREAMVACFSQGTCDMIEALIDAKIAEALHNLTPAGDDGSATRKDAGGSPSVSHGIGSPSPAGPSAPPAAGEEALAGWVSFLLSVLPKPYHGLRQGYQSTIDREIAALDARAYQRGYDAAWRKERSP